MSYARILRQHRGQIVLWARWRTISARVLALRDASELHAQFLQAHKSDAYGVAKTIGTGCWELLGEIKNFAAVYVDVLPEGVVASIEKFITQKWQVFDAAKNDELSSRAAMVLLLSLQAEVEFLLSDQQQEIRSRTERAFLHLQRVLATNEAERANWQHAFDAKGETGCEALGATHLLWHGIFAFKVNAAGARTDLVFGQPLDVTSNVRAVDGIVLTEWKIVDSRDADAKYAAARAQAELYKSGALAGIELSDTRYLVGVSRSQLAQGALPSDEERNGVLYRHINIAIEPASPSQAARRA